MNKRQEKAKSLRYRKPLLRELCLEFIEYKLCDIQEECENVRWYIEGEDDSLLESMIGDADEAYEFKMMFADLCAECERFQEDLHQEWVPDCFDTLFCATAEPDEWGGFLGYDSYENDYFDISDYSQEWIASDQAKKLKQMTKDQLIEATRQCMRVFTSYIGLKNRYDLLKTSMDVIKGENVGFLKMIKRIDELYEKAQDEKYEWYPHAREWNELILALPQEAWLQ